MPSSSGSFRRVEIRGPPDIHVWTAHFTVYRNLGIMLNIAGVLAFDDYIAKIWRFLRDYGTVVWHLLYQAEARFRLEELPEIRRRLKKEKEEVEKAGGKHPYDDERPWALAWRQATTKDSDKFWEDEFIAPATLVRLRLKTLGEVVDGDMPVATPNGPPMLTAGVVNEQLALPPPRTPVAPAPPPPKRPLALTDGTEYKWTSNKKRKALCKGYQTGACASAGPGNIICPQNKEERHQCAVCLGPHRPDECDGSGPGKDGPGPKAGGGRGRGRGKGAGRGRGANPWWRQ